MFAKKIVASKKIAALQERLKTFSGKRSRKFSWTVIFFLSVCFFCLVFSLFPLILQRKFLAQKRILLFQDGFNISEELPITEMFLLHNAQFLHGHRCIRILTVLWGDFCDDYSSCTAQ